MTDKTKKNIKFYSWLIGSIASVVFAVGYVMYDMGMYQQRVETIDSKLTTHIKENNESFKEVKGDIKELLKGVSRIEGTLNTPVITYEDK